jgi:hypothetical protein
VVGKVGGGLFISNKYYLRRANQIVDDMKEWNYKQRSTHTPHVKSTPKKKFCSCVNIKKYSVALILFYFGNKVMLLSVKRIEKIVFFH